MIIIKMNQNEGFVSLMPIAKGISFIAAVCVFSFILSAPAYAIKKCKDADGKWHYGDVAVKACENSKVTTLSKQGFVQADKERPKPKSQEQIEAEKIGLAKLEEQRKKEEEFEKEKTRILTVYESEADIDRQRDARLLTVDNNIAVHNSYIKGLENHISFDKKSLGTISNVAIRQQVEDKIAESEKKIMESKKDIESLKLQRLGMIKKFDREKSIYRELTQADKAL